MQRITENAQNDAFIIKLDPSKRYRFRMINTSHGAHDLIFETEVAPGKRAIARPPTDVTEFKCEFTVVRER